LSGGVRIEAELERRPVEFHLVLSFSTL